MYNIRLTQYMEEPRPAATQTVVAAHYYAAWKKGAPGLHNGFDDLHGYPERTPLAGYYDEEDPAYCDWEIKWASEHGIGCFIHCWYRKKENMGKPVTVADLRCGHGLHEALFNARYQKYMKFAIMYEASPRWGGTDAKDMISHLMPFWTENYFKRDNYLILDNRPVLFVYQQQRLARECFADAAEQRAVFDACREYCVRQGFDGLYIGVCDPSPSAENHADALARGYDFRFGYTGGYMPASAFPPEEEPLRVQCENLKNRLAIDPMRSLATASCFWDPTPRTTEHWNAMGYGFRKETVGYLQPDNYRRLLEEMKKIVDALPEGAWARRIFMIDNWNEWDEGHFVAPSHEFGFRYLQAIREVLTLRDNLPDYRLPQDLGLSDFNRSWGEPDLSEICRERFHLE